MPLSDAIILGILQGLTEFLPISSSGHLVILPGLLKISPPSLFFNVFLHIGTLLAVIVLWFKRIKMIIASSILFKKDVNARMGFLIIIGTIPTIIIGILFKEKFEPLFENPFLVSIFLLITGFFLFLTRFFKEKKEKINVLDALTIGLFQGIAIAPGISRSGFCISGGLLLGLKRHLAFDFAFLLSIPAIIGAFILKFKDLLEEKEPFFFFPYFTGLIVSFIVGVISLYFLGSIVRRGKVHYFSYYCFILGIIICSLQR